MKRWVLARALEFHCFAFYFFPFLAHPDDVLVRRKVEVIFSVVLVLDFGYLQPQTTDDELREVYAAVVTAVYGPGAVDLFLHGVSKTEILTIYRRSVELDVDFDSSNNP